MFTWEARKSLISRLMNMSISPSLSSKNLRLINDQIQEERFLQFHTRFKERKGMREMVERGG